MPIVKTYPLDLTGTLPGNRIKNEKHTVSPPSEITQASFIVLRACPFFEHSLVVKDGPGPTARVLNHGEDYILTHKSIALSVLCKKPVYASIMFNDRNYTGSVYVEYNTVGGDYVLDDYTIVEQLTRQKYTILNVSFDQIAGLPASYPNPPHQHDPEDMVGLSEVVAKLADLTAAIRANQGSFGVLNVGFNNHINSQSAHTSSAVGLGNLFNYETATAADYKNRAADKYSTALGVADYVTRVIDLQKQDNANTYLTKGDADLVYVKDADVYSKQESDNLYHTKAYQDTNFLKRSEALTESHVGGIVNTIVDLSQYHTRNEALGVFYTRAQADTRYYTRNQLDNNFLTQTGADLRYIQTTNPEAIILDQPDNSLSLVDGKFYVGSRAPDGIYELYIDCINGSDNSPGTRAAPLKTLKRAHALTPSNKSSTWYLRHYTVDQMESANLWYSWNFEHVINGGATRTISVYGNTWIDGSKHSSASQVKDGDIKWEMVNDVSRVPLYIRPLPSDTNIKGIYGITLRDKAEIVKRGIMLIKPKPLSPVPATKNNVPELSYFKGNGTVSLIGSWLMQVGDYKSTDSTFFRWYESTIDNEINISSNCATYGYCIEKSRNGVTEFVIDTTSAFGYANSHDRPFIYTNSLGRIVVSSNAFPGKGAVAVGAHELNTNMSVVMQRSNIFSGLNIVNNVCTNVVTNLTLTA